MHLILVSNPNPEKKIALESTRIGRGRGGDFAMARRGVGSVPRVEFRAGAHSDLSDTCAEPCCLGGRSNDTVLRSGPAGANGEVPREWP